MKLHLFWLQTAVKEECLKSMSSGTCENYPAGKIHQKILEVHASPCAFAPSHGRLM